MLGRWGRYHGLAALPIAGKSDSPIPCNLIDTAIDKEVLTRQMPEHLMAEIDRPILQIPDQSFRAAPRAESCFLLDCVPSVSRFSLPRTRNSCRRMPLPVQRFAEVRSGPPPPVATD